MSHPEVAACLAPSSLSSARNPVEYEQLWAGRRVAYEYLLTEGEHRQAALQAQRELARQGRHRAVGIPDLLANPCSSQPAAPPRTTKPSLTRYDIQ